MPSTAERLLETARTLWLDIKILWLTAKKVLVREGISAAGEATMGKFTGSAGR